MSVPAEDIERQIGSGNMIEVPELPEGGLSLGGEEQPDIANLLAIHKEQGAEALTEEEYALVMLVTQQQRKPSTDPADHLCNLAEHVDENDLSRIAQNVIYWVQRDEDSRAAWFKKERNGMRAMGVTPEVNGGATFPGASTVVHPVLAEAIVQFCSRSLEQLWPAGGPVKTTILGKTDDQRTQQAKRVEQFLNYQYTTEMPGAFHETDQMLTRLPLSGSCFVKPYYDPVNGITRGMVEPADFIVPYRAVSLQKAQRYTERILMTKNEMRKRQVSGMYRDIELSEPYEDNADTDRETVVDEIHAAEGRQDSDFQDMDHRHTVLECVCDLDLKGHEDKDEEGNLTRIKRPYIVTVDKDSQKVLAITRNWKEQDRQKRRIVYHIHYRFTPGLGFYGYGLYHLIGGLAEAATGALRALLDSAAFANMQGGFRAKDAALPNGKMTVGPGDWLEVDTAAEDLSKAFFPLPYKEPSAVLFNLLGYLENIARRFAGTTEALVGDGPQDIAVGTMLARIEQGMKVYTAIQKRLHEAAKEEYQLVAWLDSQYLPQEYPYAVEGEDRTVMATDFDSRIDIQPVSDPNTVSNMQRYFMSELVIQMADKAPDLFNRREVYKRACEALRLDNVEALLPDPEKNVRRMDPVSENAGAMTGQPLKAFPEQNHKAHIYLHNLVLQSMDPASPQAAAMAAHVQEHMAQDYIVQMSLATGVPFMELAQQELPPEVESQIAMAAAQAAEQIQMAPAAPDPAAMESEAKIKRDDEVAAAGIRRDDQVAAADIRRKDELAQSDMARKDEQAAQALVTNDVKTEQQLALTGAKGSQELDLKKKQGEVAVQTAKQKAAAAKKPGSKPRGF